MISVPSAKSESKGGLWDRTAVRTLAVACGALTIVFGLTFSMDGLAPILPAVAGGAFLYFVLLRGNPSWVVHTMLLVLFTTSVPEIPRGIRVGGIFVYFSEFLVFGSLAYALWLLRKNPAVAKSLVASIPARTAIFFSGIILLGVSLATIRGYPFWDIQYDARYVAEMMVVALIAATIVRLDDWRRYVKTITAILVFSAALMVYASVTGLVLWGRTEAAELYATGGRVLGGGSDAVRFLTGTTPLALAALLGCVALLLSGRIPARRVMPIFVSSLVICVLSFSRNTLIALGGAFLFAILIALAQGNVFRLLLRLSLGPLVATVAFAGIVFAGDALGAGDWIDTQSTGYANRVIAGFDQSNERADTSAGYREEENTYIMKTGAEHPLFGGGFGTHYKPASGKRDTFPAFEGTMYSHNAYNWLYVKVGIVGVIAFVALIAACVLPSFRRGSDCALLDTAAAVLVGLSCAIVVTPMPIEQPGSALLGAIMGICIGAGALRAQQETEQETPVPEVPALS